MDEGPMETERIALSQRERDRLKILHEVQQKHLTPVAASQRLKISDRQVRRMLLRFANEEILPWFTDCAVEDVFGPQAGWHLHYSFLRNGREFVKGVRFPLARGLGQNRGCYRQTSQQAKNQRLQTQGNISG
jgi:Homeodomain-like domain